MMKLANHKALISYSNHIPWVNNNNVKSIYPKYIRSTTWIKIDQRGKLSLTKIILYLTLLNTSTNLQLRKSILIINIYSTPPYILIYCHMLIKIPNFHSNHHSWHLYLPHPNLIVTFTFTTLCWTKNL